MSWDIYYNGGQGYNNRPTYSDDAEADGLAAIFPGAGTNSYRVMSKSLFTQGKKYAEVTSQFVEAMNIGIGTVELFVGRVLQQSGFVGGNDPDGEAFIGVNGTPYTNGDTIMIAVDIDVGKVWFGVDGDWSGDPVAGTGGHIFNFNQAIGVVADLAGESNAAAIYTLPTSFNYSPPTGFSAWGDESTERTIVLLPNFTSDDGYELYHPSDGTSDFITTDELNSVGNWNTEFDRRNYIFARFDMIDIPQGVTITGALLNPTVDYVIGTDGVATVIRAVNVDDAPPFTTSNRPSQQVDKTTASLSVIDNWDKAVINDATAIVQEIIDRPGWTAGNAIGFFGDIAHTVDGPNMAWGDDSASNSAYRAPILKITYIVPAPASITKVWTGGEWQLGIVKVRIGSAWVEKPLKVRIGSEWFSG